MNDLLQTRLSEMKRQEFLRQAEETRRAAQVPGWSVRWQLAQSLVRLAHKLSPSHRLLEPPMTPTAPKVRVRS